MVRLAFLYLGQKEPDKSEPLLIEAVEGCRAALDRNHETAAALAGLANVYADKRNLKKLGPVLIEARDITCARYGPHDQLTAEANQSVGMFFLAQPDYSHAEPYFRDSFTFWVNNDIDREDRFLNELRLGVCLLAQRNYTEAKSRRISAYNGLKPREKSAIAANAADLDHVIARITRLRDKAGQLPGDSWSFRTGEGQSSAELRENRISCSVPDVLTSRETLGVGSMARSFVRKSLTYIDQTASIAPARFATHGAGCQGVSVLPLLDGVVRREGGGAAYVVGAPHRCWPDRSTSP